MRRLFRWLLILAVVGLILLLILWWAAPALAVWQISGRLPMDLSSQARLNSLGTDGPTPAVPVRVTVRPADVQAAARWRGQWIPPGLVRSGQWLAVDWRPVPQAEPMPVVAQVGPSDRPPHIEVRLSPERLSTLVSASIKPVLGYAIAIRFDRCSGAGGPSGDAWTMPIKATGTIRLTALGGRSASMEIPVRHAEGVATVSLRPAPGGLRPEITLRITRFDTGLPTGGTLGAVVATALPAAIQASANAGIADSLAEVVLPPWVPADATADVQTVEGASF